MEILCIALQVYVIVVFARVILSWFPVGPGSAIEGINAFLYRLTEPVLGPLRRVLPPVRLGGMALDLSPLVLLLVVQIVLVPIVCTR